jgi:hypothetical protein
MKDEFLENEAKIKDLLQRVRMALHSSPHTENDMSGLLIVGPLYKLELVLRLVKSFVDRLIAPDKAVYFELDLPERPTYRHTIRAFIGQLQLNISTYDTSVMIRDFRDYLDHHFRFGIIKGLGYLANLPPKEIVQTIQTLLGLVNPEAYWNQPEREAIPLLLFSTEELMEAFKRVTKRKQPHYDHIVEQFHHAFPRYSLKGLSDNVIALYISPDQDEQPKRKQSIIRIPPKNKSRFAGFTREKYEAQKEGVKREY